MLFTVLGHSNDGAKIGIKKQTAAVATVCCRFANGLLKRPSFRGASDYHFLLFLRLFLRFPFCLIVGGGLHLLVEL